MSREILRDALIYLPARIIPALVGVLAIPLLTRILAPEAYGHYLLALSSLTLIAGFALTWLVSVVVRFYVVLGVERLFRLTLPLVATAVVTALVIWVGVALVLGAPFSQSRFMLIGMLWIVSHAGFEYLAGWLRVRNYAAAYGIAVSWRSIAGLVITLTLLSFDFTDGEIVILGTALAAFVAIAWMPSRALRTETSPPAQTDAALSAEPMRAMLRYGLPAAVSNLVIAGLSFADRYVIEGYLGTKAVAIYGANYDLAEKTIFFVNTTLLLSSSVMGFRIFEREGEAKAAEFIGDLMRFYLRVAPLIVVALMVLSPQIISVLLPAEYQQGAGVLGVVAVGGLCVGIMHRYSLILSFHKRTDSIMWCSGAALAINLLCCVLLIPVVGLMGAAVSTLLAYASWLFLIRLSARKHVVPSFPWTTLVRVVCAAAVAGAAMYWIVAAANAAAFIELTVSIAAGMAVYLLALLCFREIPVAAFGLAIRRLRQKLGGR